MSSFKKLTTSALAAAIAAGSLAMTTTANAGLNASVGVSNFYLWRGLDLGNGSAAVSGDLVYDIAGVYVGTWMSSGDSTAGTEIDFFAGYSNSWGGFFMDLGAVTYEYPSTSSANGHYGKTSDGYLNLGYDYGVGSAGIAYWQSLQTSESGYLTVDASYSDFGLKLGYHNKSGDENSANYDKNSFAHADLSYSPSAVDGLTFTLSQKFGYNDDVVAGTQPYKQNSTLLVNVSYSMGFDLAAVAEAIAE